MQRGLTLIELVLVFGIFAIVSAGVVLFADDIGRLADFIEQDLQNQQNLEQGFQRLVSEIRSMGPSELGSYAIEAASSSSLTFFSDYDGDGIAERVRYFLSTSTVERGIVEPTTNPVTYVTSTEVRASIVTSVLVASTTPLFRYYDTNYSGTQSPLADPVNIAQIRVVKIRVVVDTVTQETPLPLEFNRTITIRNLRDN